MRFADAVRCVAAVILSPLPHLPHLPPSKTFLYLMPAATRIASTPSFSPITTFGSRQSLLLLTFDLLVYQSSLSFLKHAETKKLPP